MSTSVSTAVALNITRTCAARGCTNTRYLLQSWCSQHRDKANAYGHPHARPFRPSTWASQRKEVSKLFEANPNHPGMQVVLKWIDGWLQAAVHGSGTAKGRPEMARLAAHGVTSMRLLTEVIAFWVWVADNPHALPDDKARDFACSRAVFNLAPRIRTAIAPKGSRSGTWGLPTNTPQSYAVKARHSSLSYVGRFLRTTLAAFIANSLLGVQTARTTTRDPEALMKVPFALPELRA